MNKKNIIRLRTAAVLIAGFILSLLLTFAAFAADTRVYDDANLFSPEGEFRISEEIERVRQHTGLDIVVVTTLNKQGMDTQTFADEVYERGGFGTGNSHSGLIYLIDMEDRVPCISTEGGAITLLSDSEIEKLLDGAYNYLSNADFAGSAVSVVRGVAASYDDALDKGWTYDKATGEWQAPVKKRSLSPWKLLLSALAALGSGFGAKSKVERQYAMKDTAGAASFNTARLLAMAGCAFAFSGKADDLLNSRTERRALPKVRSGGSSGGGPHGHSTTHTSSSGRVHGGGVGRKF